MSRLVKLPDLHLNTHSLEKTAAEEAAGGRATVRPRAQAQASQVASRGGGGGGEERWAFIHIVKEGQTGPIADTPTRVRERNRVVSEK